MEVPFVSSGAMSRAHYALVRKVELATTPQAADAILLAEIEAIHYRLTHSTLTQKQVKECLILLLYCTTAMAPGATPDTSFSLPHAISLAEAGKTVQDKKIGYLFCVETMPKHHELQLMLVNTLRKDLHSDEVPRIALALDVLIQIPPEDVIPAIQDRLFELLSHTSPLVRRRVLFTYRSLSEHDRNILKHIVDKTRKRLEDHDHAVMSAALALCIELRSNDLLPDTTYHVALIRLIKSTWKSLSRHHTGSWILLKGLQALRATGSLSSEDFDLIHGIVSSKPKAIPLANAIIYECFSLLGSCSNIETSKSSTIGRAFIDCIRDWLTSDDMNDIYTFVKCLECLDPKYWAGTSSNVPAVLEAWEVERIMTLLGCNDQLIRKKVLCILLKVDRNIVESYFAQISASNFSAVLQDGSGNLKKALEVIEVLSGDDGEAYAQQVVHMLTSVSDNPHRKDHVYEGAIEEVLSYIRNSSVEFRSGCLGVLFALLAEHERSFDSSLATILSALICEYLDSCPSSPEDILKGLATIIPSHGAAIQDACLLAMLRVAANCQTIPEEVLGVVRKLQETGGRYIKRRSTQFLELSQSPQTLKDIVSHTKSNSLPDFLLALETYQGKEQVTNNISRVSSSSAIISADRPSSRASSAGTGSKLRYTAYEAPRPTPKLRRRASTSSSLSTHSDASRASEELARTFTPGELALATGRTDLHEIGRSPMSSPPTLPSVQIMDEDELANQVDLITLESPFVSEPQASIASLAEPEFEVLWNSLANANSRGWYGGPLDEVVRKLQGLQRKLRVTPADQPPFTGYLKVIISVSTPSEHDSVLLRLREDEDDSCIWHLRCADASLRDSITALLKDA